jgi:hypothetical protein
MADFRDLRTELEHAAQELELAENALLCSSFHNSAVRAKAAARRARAALAQPEPEGLPTDEQWDAIKDRLWDKYETVGHQGERFMSNDDFDTALDVARKDLTHFARPTIKPVPVAERPWEREGWCDAEGRCWWLTLAAAEGGRGGYSTFWELTTFKAAVRCASHWLPHHALPVPGAEGLGRQRESQ